LFVDVKKDSQGFKPELGDSHFKSDCHLWL